MRGIALNAESARLHLEIGAKNFARARRNDAHRHNEIWSAHSLLAGQHSLVGSAFDIADAHTAFELARSPHHDAPLTKDLWYCAYAPVKGAALGIIP